MSHSVARRCLPAVPAGALLLPLGVAAQQVFVNGPVQLYAGPAPGYPAIATLYPGAELSVVGCLADWQWCDVLLPDGLRGWVFAPNLSYAWMGNALPVPQYGPAIGIPLIGFAVGDYWGRHYRHQPWYDDSRWRAPPPPPVRVLPPTRDGWQAPFPPRWEREATPPPRWGRDPRWDAPPPRHDMG
uniref:SH3 domain-containing protein n=1 Tax=Zoogloea sp. TaxID=49181 RepID=UPI0035B3C7A5